MKTIVLIVRGDVNISPTVPNYLSAFVRLGLKVFCVCSSVNDDSKIDGVTYFSIGYGHSKNRGRKLLNYYLFGSAAAKLLRNNSALSNVDFVWVSRIDTALCLGRSKKSNKSILALHELHDAYPIWKFITRYVIKSYSGVVYNEYNRAQIGRVFYNLMRLPYVIPNKPAVHPREKSCFISDDSIRVEIESLNDKFLIVYQGSLEHDRNLMPLVKAVKNLGEKFHLIIMGKDPHDRVSQFLAENENILYIPWVLPPNHLNITSHCHLGVAFYDVDCLNSIYCAPNKIWEYSGFGIPVLGQNIPGLLNTVAQNRFGICVELDDIHVISKSISEIYNDYEVYRANASQFYDSVDFDLLVSDVLEDIS